MNRAVQRPVTLWRDPARKGEAGDGWAATTPFHRCSLMIRFQVFGSILMGAHAPLTKLTNPPWYETVPYRNNRPSKASACCARSWFTNGSCLYLSDFSRMSDLTKSSVSTSGPAAERDLYSIMPFHA